MKKFIVFQIVVAILVIATFSSAAKSNEITLGWSLPSYTVLDNNCAEQGYPIPADKTIGVTVRYKVNGAATWNEAETAVGATSYTVTGLAPETTYELSVGPHYVGGTVLCFSPSVLATTPALPPPQGCSNVVVTNVK